MAEFASFQFRGFLEPCEAGAYIDEPLFLSNASALQSIVVTINYVWLNNFWSII